MKIENLEIKGFGKLNNVSFKFKDGFNIIYGLNESGKTSMQMFIKSMLYGIKGGRQSKDGTPPMLKKYKPWNSDSYGGSMQYRLDDGKCYRVERNFNTGSVKIYDSQFNDITAGFDAVKGKGVLFAEKHLGLNENCFNKTVFVKQLDIKVDNDGADELQNKLINIAQSGYEDISYSKARSALIETSRNYIGTGKTTTKPLDILTAKLAELNERYKLLQEKRASLLDTEKALKKALEDIDTLTSKKQMLQNEKDQINKKMHLEQLNKDIKNLTLLLEEIRAKEAEYKKATSELDEMSVYLEKNSALNSFGSEESENISIIYYKYCDMLENQKKLHEQIDTAKASIDAAASRLEELKRLSAVDKSGIDAAVQARRELDRLLVQQKAVPAGGRGRASAAPAKPASLRACVFAAIICLLAAAASGAAAFSGLLPHKYLLSGISAAGVVAAGIALYLRHALKVKSSQQKKEKSDNAHKVALIEKIKFNKQIIDNFLTNVGFTTLEDFFNAKGEYDSIKEQHINLNYQINMLEHESLNNSKQINELKNTLIQKLSAAGIMPNISEMPPIDKSGLSINNIDYKADMNNLSADIDPYDSCIYKNEIEIKEEYIKMLTQAIKNFRETKLKQSYLKQRTLELDKDIELLYRKINTDYNINLSNSIELENKINELKEKTMTFEAQDITDGSLTNLIHSRDNYNIDSEYEAVCEEINNLNLKVKEYQMLIRDSLNDSDELQRLDEEIYELQQKKSRLEDINYSLRTALEVLDEASAEIKNTYSPLLNNCMSKYVKRITNGKYSDLRADDDLHLNVVAPETGEVVNISCLSGGAMDQLYLSLRLSMAGLMSGNGETLPLILDEIFSQYDDERTQSTLEFIKEEFPENQLLLFTCKKREVDIASKVFGPDLNIIRLS